MVRLACITLVALLCFSCAHDKVEEDTLVQYYAPYRVHLTVDEGALAFFAQATKDEIFRDSVFPAEVGTVWPSGVATWTNAQLNLHGESSIELPRKSFEVKLPQSVALLGGGVKMRKFFLVAMEQDLFYFRNVLGFSLLAGVRDLFLGEFRYVRVSLNGVDQGLYLLIERPQDAIARRFPGAIVFRRNYDNGWYPKGDVKEDPVVLEQALAELRALGELPGRFQGQELFDSLRIRLDLDQYFAWLAVNRLLHNGDYSDEVFFYRTAPGERWRIMGWDYEDIFMSPHAGRFRAGSWLFCNEDALDSAIADNAELNSAYELVLRQVAMSLDSATLGALFADVRGQLLPWFDDMSLATINANFHSDATTARALLASELDTRATELLRVRDTLIHIPHRP